MDIKSIIIGAIGLLVGGGIVLATVVVTTKPATTTTQPFGSLTGPEIPYDHLTVGGVPVYRASQTMTQNASTTCDFVSPSATSSLQFAVARFTLASTSASIVEIGRSLGGDATTTLIGTTYAIGAGVPATIVASTSPAAGDPEVFGPNTHLSVKLGGAAGNVPTGTCVAEWVAIP